MHQTGLVQVSGLVISEIAQFHERAAKRKWEQVQEVRESIQNLLTPSGAISFCLSTIACLVCLIPSHPQCHLIPSPASTLTFMCMCAQSQTFLDLYNLFDFVAMGQALEVLNSVRFCEIGIPLTHSQ